MAEKEKKGFASMPHKKVEEIARKGGQARAHELGHEGYAELGSKGGQKRAQAKPGAEKSHARAKGNTDGEEN